MVICPNCGFDIHIGFEPEVMQEQSKNTKLKAENERLHKQKAFLICCIKSGEQLSEKDLKELEE